MSNHNAYWGKRFGFLRTETVDKVPIVRPAFPVKQLGSGANRSGPHQASLDPRSPLFKQSQADKALHLARGVPALVFDGATCKRIGGPIYG